MMKHNCLIVCLGCSLLPAALALTLMQAYDHALASPVNTPLSLNSANAVWAIETVQSTGDVGRYPSLVIDPQASVPRVTYYDATGGWLREAIYAPPSMTGCSSNNWNCSRFGTSPGQNVGTFSSLAIGIVSNTFSYGVAYHNVTSASLDFWGDIGLDSFVGQLDAPLVGGAGFYNALKYDHNGVPHIGYEGVNAGSPALRYAKYMGAGNGNCGKKAAQFYFQCDTIDFGFGGVGSDASLDLNFLGQPRIAYHDFDLAGNNSFLSLASYVGGGGTGCTLVTWRCEVVDDSSDPANISLHVTGCIVSCPDATQIAYDDLISQTLRYAVYVGSGGTGCGGTTAWDCQTIEEVGTDAGAMGVSLAVDGNGSPLIAYHVKNATYPIGVLKSARPVGHPANCGPLVGQFHFWQCDVVDDGSVFLGAPHNVGQYASLALNSAGLAAIAYYDATSHDLKVARQVLPTFLPLVSR